MILIPSLELLDGKVVALAGSGPDDATVLAEDAIEAARALRDQGAVFFHVVDLDAALGRGDNDVVVQKLVEAGLPCQVAGGVRDAARAERLFELGADRVVLGTVLYDESDAAREVVDRHAMRVMGALDLEDGTVRTHAREKSQELDLDAALEVLHGLDLKQVVHTSVRPGSEPSGPDLDSLKALLGKTSMQVFANVEVRGRDDLQALSALVDDGLTGVVLATACRALQSASA
jgi:phosphoribosylformimino-5-aminoimidazole carboxamide ribotide isomerase